MATITSFTCTPNPIPAGGEGTITVAFQTSAGTPDQTITVTVTDNGQKQGSLDVVLKGTPGEATPQLSVGSTGTGWEIQTTAGTLTAGSAPNTFTLA